MVVGFKGRWDGNTISSTLSSPKSITSSNFGWFTVGLDVSTLFWNIIGKTHLATQIVIQTAGWPKSYSTPYCQVLVPYTTFCREMVHFTCSCWLSGFSCFQLHIQWFDFFKKQNETVSYHPHIRPMQQGWSKPRLLWWAKARSPRINLDSWNSYFPWKSWWKR